MENINTAKTHIISTSRPMTYSGGSWVWAKVCETGLTKHF